MHDTYVAIAATFLFWIAVLLVFVGASLILVPARFLAAGSSLNRWISSKEFFDWLNAPIYQERLFYRHHRVTGALVVLASAYCLYRLAIGLGPARIEDGLGHFTTSPFLLWLLPLLVWVLMGALVVAAAVGVLVFARPSLLKRIEATANLWVESESSLSRLDNVRNIPSHILPGRPRLFGAGVVLGAVYIIYLTHSFVL